MRSAVRTVCVLIAVAAVAIACGSGAGSEFVDPTAGLDEAGIPPIGNFNPPDGGIGDGGNATCKKITCASAGATCGPIGDGCGGVVQCGTCSNNESCGGGGKPSVCGKPPCTKKTCAEQGGANCGALGDGCGGLITSCGTCPAGQSCGLGGPSKCGAGGVDGGACVPTKTACAAGDCGPIANGCGAIIDCSPPAWPACPVGQSCGGGGTPSLCGAPPCVKKTCGTQNCGFIADGCGGVVSCWPAAPAPAVCPPGQSCGGAGVANTCGVPAGCTGLCLQQQSCPGGGTTSIEGYVTSPNGVLPVPNAVVYVPNGAVAAFVTGVACETCATASGSPLVSTTTDANGHFSLPNMPVSTAGKVVDIPVVVQLGRWRKQFTIQTTACVNNLVPSVGVDVPAKTAALPGKKSEGDIPLTAISTGQVDGLECVFRKMGVDDTEFTDGSGAGRIRLYRDNGATISGGSPGASALYNPPANNATGNISGATNASPIVITTTAAHGLATGAIAIVGGVKGNTASNGTWIITVVDATHFSLNTSTGNAAYTSNGTWISCAGPTCKPEIDKYDAVIFGCVGSEVVKPTNALLNVLGYANKGGRVFGTHYSYVWLNTPTTWGSTMNQWDPANELNWDNGTVTAPVDTSFPKGLLFATWLQAPVAPLSASFPPPYAPLNALSSTSPPMIALTEPRRDATPTAPNVATSGVIAPAQRWLFTTDDDGQACPAAPATCKSGVCNAGKCVGTVVESGADPAAVDAPMHYTFNTDTKKPAAQQCGRVLYSDFHVSIGNTNGRTFPAECNNGALTSQEKVLAYFLFDLASCVSASGPPACMKKTCTSQGLGCGLAGDGCGNQIDCGPCPAGQTCGGGGVPSQCGAPVCTAKKCSDFPAGTCGKLGDGCGGLIDCGSCAGGMICGGGGANLCGAAVCNPTACPMPAPGSVCGPVANGCGQVNNCPCPPATPCVNGLCGAPACTPRTCAQAGANCGTIADGCGGTQMCGNCIAPQTCGGGGTANLCGGGVN